MGWMKLAQEAVAHLAAIRQLLAELLEQQRAA